MGVWVALAFCARVGCARRIWWVRAGGCLVDVWLLACVGVLLARERGLACVRVAWINEKGREREPVSVGSLSLSFSSFVERMTGLEPATFTLGWWCSVG